MLALLPYMLVWALAYYAGVNVLGAAWSITRWLVRVLARRTRPVPRPATRPRARNRARQ